MAVVIDCRHCAAGSTRDDITRYVAEKIAAAHSRLNPGHSVQVLEADADGR